MAPYAKPAASACARSGACRRSPTADRTTLIGIEGRYGVEDARHAVREARRQGLDLFCIAFNTEAEAPLSHRLGGGFATIRRPSQPPRRCARLTR